MALGLAKKGEGLEEDLDECRLVIYKDEENLNSEGIGRRGMFIYCQYSRSGARFFVFNITIVLSSTASQATCLQVCSDFSEIFSENSCRNSQEFIFCYV
jgi:hypothetical protein